MQEEASPSIFERHQSQLGFFGGVVVGLLLIGALINTRAVRGRLEIDDMRHYLAHEQVQLKKGSLHWIESEGGLFSPRRAVFIGKTARGLDDVFLARVHFYHRHLPFKMITVFNLSRSPLAHERALHVMGSHVLYVSTIHGRDTGLVVLDLNGEPSALTRGWSLLAKAKNAITNLQLTGSRHGFGRWYYKIRSGAAFSDARIVNNTISGAVIHDRSLVVVFYNDKMPARRESIALNVKQPPRYLGAFADLDPPSKSEPGYITWVVDTVRRVSWIGPERIAWLEQNVFALSDWFKRKTFALFGKQSGKDVASELAANDNPKTVVKLNVSPAEIGWPPAKATPIIRPALKGEGEWKPVADDPFVRTYPNAPHAFYQTFLRADEERLFAPIYVTIWDPRQVQLNIVAGTVEPESATGETGSGLIPRDPWTLDHVVAAFNGGFQAMHGEFGMMTERVVYLPPKPWSATVAVMDDGRVAMGSWLAPPAGKTAYEEAWANAQIPSDMVAMRQNLTSVVEDGVYNPWKRWWWGAAPLNAKEQTFTDRSAICLTNEGHMAYFWGSSMGPEALGAAMIAVRCKRGMHLDMNSGHCGFEFLRAQPKDQPLPPLTKPISQAASDSEYEGVLPLVEGYQVRVRKAVSSMTNMRFPRYTTRDARDFFYLTLKGVLPGADVAIEAPWPGGPREIRFSTQGLPHRGWPYPFAIATLKRDDGYVLRLLRLDPRRAQPDGVAADVIKSPTHRLATLFWQTPSENKRGDDAKPALWFVQRVAVGWRYAVGSAADAARVHAQVLAQGRLLETSSMGFYAVGVDQEGFAVYAEQNRPDTKTLVAVLERLGVKQALELSTQAGLAFEVDGHMVGLDSTTVNVPSKEQALHFWAETRAASETLFPDTKPRPYGVWGYLQGQRVRYIPQNPPRFHAPGPDGGAGVGAGSTTTNMTPSGSSAGQALKKPTKDDHKVGKSP